MLMAFKTKHEVLILISYILGQSILYAFNCINIPISIYFTTVNDKRFSPR